MTRFCVIKTQKMSVFINYRCTAYKSSKYKLLVANVILILLNSITILKYAHENLSICQQAVPVTNVLQR